MRVVGLVCLAALAVGCAHAAPTTPEKPVAASTVETERAENEAAYRAAYLPRRSELVAKSRGAWLAVVRGRLVPAEPAAAMEDVDAAARAVDPNAKHRFVIRIGEEGDVDWPANGYVPPHALGRRFYSLLDAAGVRAPHGLSADPVLYWFLGDTYAEITIGAQEDDHPRLWVGPPGAPGVAVDAFRLAVDFDGFAALPPESATGLELWEIPGVARVRGAPASGECRRAWARFRWPKTQLDFTVPVAIWPK